MELSGKVACGRAIVALIELVLASGSLAAGSLRMGWRRNYFSRVLSRGAMEFRGFFATMAAFGVEHQRLASWSQCVERHAALERFGDEALELAIRLEPEPVKRVRLAYLRGELPSGEVGIVQDHGLKEIDEQRYNNAAEAASRAEGMVAAVQGGQSAAFVARALGVWASALRQCHQLDGAHVVLWTAMRIAASEENDSLLAGLARRAAFLLSDRGRFDQAVAMAECGRALLEADGGDDHAYGRADLVIGTMCYNGGEFQRAARNLRRALSNLGSGDVRRRSAALHLLSDIYLRADDLRQADSYAKAAIACGPDDRHACVRLHWLRARVACRKIDLPAAAEHYQQALVRLGQESPVDAVLLAAERAGVLLRLGRPETAREELRALAWAVIPFEQEVPAAGAALARLIRASMAKRRLRHELVAAAVSSIIATGAAALAPPAQPSVSMAKPTSS